jgi:uncharacterized protein YjdB
MGKYKNWVLLANAFDKTLLRNKLVFDFSEEIGLRYTPNFKVVDVWLNGIYIGNYLLGEPIEVNKDRVNIDTSKNDYLLELEASRFEGDVTYLTTEKYKMRFALNEPEILNEAQMDYLNNFFKDMESAISSGDYELYSKYIDIESFVDFYIVEEYFKNVDVSFSSTRFYIKNDKLYAGPVWDFDLSAGNANNNNPDYLTYNNVDSTGNSYEGLWADEIVWYKVLFRDNYFFNKVKNRYAELQGSIVNLYENNEKGKNKIDALLEENTVSFYNNYTEAGWDVSVPTNVLERYPDSTYEENVEFLRQWLKNRNEWLLSYWESDITESLDYTSYNKVVSYANSLQRNNYTNFYIVETALNFDVKYEGVTQVIIDNQVKLIKEAINKLVPINSGGNSGSDTPSGGYVPSVPVPQESTESTTNNSTKESIQITLSSDKEIVNKGKKLQLSAKIENDSETGIKLIWESSNEQIVKVNNEGIVTALKAGEATITVRTEDGKTKASCTITVKNPSIKLDKSSEVLYTKGVTQLTLNAKADGANNNVKWKSSNSTVAVVENGAVTAKSAGTAWITASANGVYKSCKVVVKDAKLVLNKKTATLYTKGITQVKLSAIYGEKTSKAVWKTSNSKIATVKNGVVTAIAAGKVKISASIDGKTVTCTITVKKPSLKLDITRAEIKKGKTVKIKANITPAGTVKYTSSNISVATVTKEGVVKGISKGETTIEVSGSGIKRIYTVIVK